MRNEEVIKAFIEGDEKAHTKNVFIKDNFLFSYGFHFLFPRRYKFSDGAVVGLFGFLAEKTSRKLSVFAVILHAFAAEPFSGAGFVSAGTVLCV